MADALRDDDDLFEDKGEVVTEESLKREKSRERLTHTFEDVEDTTPNEEDEDDVEIVIAKEEASKKPKKPLGSEPELGEDDDDELKTYSGKVRKRIEKLTFEAREQRRQAEEFSRRQDIAIEAATRLNKENLLLKKALQNGQKLIAGEVKGRAEQEMNVAKAKLRSAKELGDIDKEIEASQEIARLAVEIDKAASFKPTPVDETDSLPAELRKPVRPEPDAAAKMWHRKNPWFGKDDKMTAYAKHVHEKLTVFDSVDPRSSDYWSKMDLEMRKRFPHLQGEEDDEGGEEDTPTPVRKRPSTVVAPPPRNKAGGTSREKVTLSESEVAIAKRIGVPLKEYAKAKARGTI